MSRACPDPEGSGHAVTTPRRLMQAEDARRSTRDVDVASVPAASVIGEHAVLRAMRV